MADGDVESDKRTDVLKRVAQFTALFVFYLYFAGWMYTNQIFAEFGLSLNVIDEPAYFLIVYAYRVFFSSPLGVLVFIALTAFGYLLVLTKKRWVEFLLVGILVVAPFPAISWLATHTAQERAAEIRSGAAIPISFTLRPEAQSQYPPNVVTALAQSENLYVIAQTTERYYVFFQPPPEPGSSELPRAFAYDVKADDVIAIKRLVNVRKVP